MWDRYSSGVSDPSRQSNSDELKFFVICTVVLQFKKGKSPGVKARPHEGPRAERTLLMPGGMVVLHTNATGSFQRNGEHRSGQMPTRIMPASLHEAADEKCRLSIYWSLVKVAFGV